MIRAAAQCRRTSPEASVLSCSNVAMAEPHSVCVSFGQIAMGRDGDETRNVAAREYNKSMAWAIRGSLYSTLARQSRPRFNINILVAPPCYAVSITYPSCPYCLLKLLKFFSLLLHYS
ncbi:jg20799 [Pararge aegeria aegeria]|uniref:Jg20799 protein n=1 Tax=Pararge aegeria aegeria TaxID=348720 RepID=A0A8S4R5P0_9NEOP|nr:jg20799 [Pararge aegeria aegeria]